MIATGGLVQMLVIPLLVVLAPTLQAPDTVAVRVRVTDAASNDPIAAVSVRLLDVQNGVLASGITDTEGLFVQQIQARPTIQVKSTRRLPMSVARNGSGSPR